MCTIAAAMPLAAPLLMPSQLMAKSYVRRDLGLLGIEVYPVERPVLIRKALVLPKMRHSHYFTRNEVVALRRALRVEPPLPRNGSILYLSREGERGEFIDREYPSAEISPLLEQSGVKIVRARETSLEQYRELASEAETVVADHGAAMCNLIFWNTKHVIELFNKSWWANCFLMLANAMEIQDYALVRVNDRNPEEIVNRVLQHVRQFQSKEH
jgi:capsular polysaccharide biosynthesis protein